MAPATWGGVAGAAVGAGGGTLGVGAVSDTLIFGARGAVGSSRLAAVDWLAAVGCVEAGAGALGLVRPPFSAKRVPTMAAPINTTISRTDLRAGGCD